MKAESARRRILLAAETATAEPILQLFKAGPLDSWEIVHADCLAQVCFFMQHHPCDVSLVHEDLLFREGEPALGWMARNPEIPVVFLTSYHGETIARAYRHGVTICLPRDLSVSHPWLLDAALGRALEIGTESRGRRRSLEQLQQCRRHIDRLVQLIWRTSPMEPNTHWFTQRHTMERLQEEIARSQRHGGPLTLALAEVHAADKSEETEGAVAPVIKLETLTSEIVSRSKRRCDVAGQYGMQGFLLMMVQTPQHGGVICCKRLKQLLEKAAADVATDAATDAATGPRGPVRAYFGLATSSSKQISAPRLLRCAEQNLEAAKAGKDEGVVAG